MAEAEKRWAAVGGLPYRFLLQRVSLDHSVSFFSGTVTVRDRQKVVSGATLNGQPLDQPDLEDFPAIEELFAALKTANQAGCRQCHVVYDPEAGFPVRCLIDQRVASVSDPGRMVEYRVSEMTFLEGSASSE